MLNVIFIVLSSILLLIGILILNNKFRLKSWKTHSILVGIFIFLSLILGGLWLLIGIAFSADNDSIGIFASSSLRISAFIWIGCLIQTIKYKAKNRIFAYDIWIRRTFVCLIMVIVQYIILRITGVSNPYINWLPIGIIFGGYELFKYLNLFPNQEKN